MHAEVGKPRLGLGVGATNDAAQARGGSKSFAVL